MIKLFLSLALSLATIQPPVAAANLLSVTVPVAPTTFNAKSIPGLIGWFKANTGVTGTSSVTAWTDQSVVGNNLTCTGSPVYSATSFNGYAGVTFSGGTAQCTVATAGTNAPVSVFMAVSPITGGNTQYSNLFSSVSQATGTMTFEIGAIVNRIDVWSAGHAAYASSGAGSFTSGNYYMVGYTYDGAGNLSTYLGSSAAASTASMPASFLGATWIVGSAPTGFDAVWERVAEIAIYNQVPSGGNITSLHTAWVNSYGIN